MSHVVKKGNKPGKTVFALLNSVRLTYGWSIGISYAIRNHFVHDGGQLDGSNFFRGPTAASAFEISDEGWKRVRERAKGYGVLPSHRRLEDHEWPVEPPDDLRIVLDRCERETDDALGVLIGTACHFLRGHLAYMLGEV